MCPCTCLLPLSGSFLAAHTPRCRRPAKPFTVFFEGMAWRWTVQETTGRPPSPRAGFASALINETLYVAGGWDGTSAFGDAFAVSIETRHWRQLAVRGREGATLEGRILFAHASIGSTLFMHGGAEATNLANMHSDLLALDTRTSTLRVVATGGVPPGPLMRHSMAARENSLWMFGGFRGRAFSADMYQLEFHDIYGDAAVNDGMPEAMWRPVKAIGGFAPWPRALGCLLALPPPASHLLMLGGGDGDADFDDAYAFDATASTWQRLTNITGELWALSNAACLLLPRNGGTVGERGDVESSAVIIHGGFGGPSSNRSAHRKQSAARVMELAPNGWRWSEMKTSGSTVSPRMSHRMAVRNSSLIVMFGGNGDGEHLRDLVFGRPNRAEQGSEASRPIAGSSEACTRPFEAASVLHDDDDEDDIIVRTVRVSPPGKLRRRTRTQGVDLL